MPPAKAIRHLADERAQHLLHDLEVNNRARTDRPVDLDAARFASQELQCFMAHGHDFAVVAVDRHH